MDASRFIQNKLHVLFPFREYLSGFRKRKQERRKKARDDLELQVKEERKRLKQEVQSSSVEIAYPFQWIELQAREDLKSKFKLSFAPIPELADELNEEEFETDDVKVKIVEISTSELAKSNNWIGENRPKYSDDEDDDGETDKGKISPEICDGIPGMDLTFPVKSKPSNKSTTAIGSVNETTNEKPSIIDHKSYKSKKNLTGTVHQKAVKALKSSKAFQMKRKLDQLKDRKKARLEREKRQKIHNKAAKKHNGKLNARKLKKKKSKTR